MSYRHKNNVGFYARKSKNSVRVTSNILDALAKKTGYNKTKEFSNDLVNYSMYLYLIRQIANENIHDEFHSYSDHEKNIYMQGRIDLAVDMVDDIVNKLVNVEEKEDLKSITDNDLNKYSIASKNSDLWKAKESRVMSSNSSLLPFAVSHITSLYGLKGKYDFSYEDFFTNHDKFKGQELEEVSPVSEEDVLKKLAKALNLEYGSNDKEGQKDSQNNINTTNEKNADFNDID